MNYPGHKKIYGVYHKIINEIPPHKIFYELFAGSAAISKLLYPSSFNPDIQLQPTVRSGNDPIIILNDLLPVHTVKNICMDRPDLTVKNNCIGHNVKFQQRNAFDILQTELTVSDLNTFIFIDPPYLHSTRPNNTKLYKYELTESDHIQLITSVLQLQCNVMIIHPKCSLYDNSYLKHWRQVPIKIRYHNKLSLECLYMNYAAPDKLQNDSLLGKDCWDRQRIKRKGDRLVNKLLALPELERNYVINKIKNL